MILALAIVACLNYSPMFVEGGNWIDCPDTGENLLTDSCSDYEQFMDGNSSPYSCTPWNFRAYNDNCGNPDDRIVAGDGTNDVGAFASDNADNFFVFHSCDGAGAITDCYGNQNFVEQFGPWCGANGDDGNDCSIQCDVHAPGGDDNPSGQHQQCAKYHDGTGKWYEWFKCGNWYAKDQFAYGASGGFNEYHDWFTQGLFPNSNYIDTFEPDGTAVLYNWVCHKDTSTNKNLQAFTDDSEVNCYCDNEPNTYSGGGVPPGAAVYSFWVKWDANRNGGNGEWYLEMHDITSGWEVGDIFNIYPFYTAW